MELKNWKLNYEEIKETRKHIHKLSKLDRTCDLATAYRLRLLSAVRAVVGKLGEYAQAKRDARAIEREYKKFLYQPERPMQFRGRPRKG